MQLTVLLIALIYAGRAWGDALSCTFVEGMCGWSGTGERQIAWRRGTGPTEDRTSGLLGTRTDGDGSYAYIRGSDTHDITWHARLTSPKVEVQDPTWLTFWYHMNGVGVGELTLMTFSDDGSLRILWRRAGRQGNSWLQGNVTLALGVYRLIFEASTRLHYGSDIAIDDILLSREPLVHPDPTTTMSTTTPTTTPLAVTESIDMTCDFEAGLCVWQTPLNHGSRWIRNQGPSPDRSSGPPGDHTSGSGWYVYLNTAHGVQGEGTLGALLTSPYLNVTLPGSLSFWYQMNGPGIGALELWSVDLHSSQQTPLFQVQGRQGTAWEQATVGLQTGDYKLEFRGSAHLHYGSDIALDDIRMEATAFTVIG